MRGLLLLLACAASLSAVADEGMWTFDNFPAGRVKQLYGVQISADWLNHVRLSTLRLANCSASFVSAEGLILTNQHCIQPCLAEQSSTDNSLIDSGFLAPSRREELRCPAQQADVLMASEDITDRVLKATASLSETAANEARKRLLITLEQSCEQSSQHARSGKLKCQAVTLYQGGQFFLYKYKRYDDVRLVFVPEGDIASFGGDPDNFQFPRWSLDFAILRAYENGSPAKTPNHLSLDFDGPKEGQPVLVAGQPGSTARLQTRAQLEFERDTSLPITLLRAAELRGRYLQFAKIDPAHERIVHAPLNALENIIKVRRKELDALNDPMFWAQKNADEERLRRSAPARGPDPWTEIEAAMSRERAIYLPYVFIENGAGFTTSLFRDARWLVRGTAEAGKPNGERLREFTDAALPTIERGLFARVPVYAEYEQMTFSFSLERMRELLGPDYPVVHRLFARQSPDGLATQLIAETQLDDAEVRRRLWESGKPAVEGSRDPMIDLARSVDREARAIRAQYEDQVEAPVAAAAQRIAAVRFALDGTRTYPDATFTLRLNYGSVQGWTEDGTAIEPMTHLERAFERASGVAPFKIPDKWMRLKGQLDLRTPFCIATSNDIVGGNSGSPLLDASGRLVGLMFDGNIHSVAGRYWFDPANNRAVALHPAIIRLALDQVYGAHDVLAELSRDAQLPGGANTLSGGM
jgi:hypothetical protein